MPQGTEYTLDDKYYSGEEVLDVLDSLLLSKIYQRIAVISISGRFQRTTAKGECCLGMTCLGELCLKIYFHPWNQ